MPLWNLNECMLIRQKDQSYEIAQSITCPHSAISEKNNFENAKFLTIDQNLLGTPFGLSLKNFSAQIIYGSNRHVTLITNITLFLQKTQNSQCYDL